MIRENYHHISDIINEVLIENKKLSDRWLEYIKKNHNDKERFYLNHFILDFIRDFHLVNDLKEYIKTSLEVCLDNENLKEKMKINGRKKKPNKI